MTGWEMTERLAGTAPAAAAVVNEHLHGYEGELLLHVLLADIGRLTVTMYENGEEHVLAAVLAVLELGLLSGNAYVENAVAVSYVEWVGPWDEAMRGFIGLWPQELAAEARRQRLL